MNFYQIRIELVLLVYSPPQFFSFLCFVLLPSRIFSSLSSITPTSKFLPKSCMDRPYYHNTNTQQTIIGKNTPQASVL